jgi:predicted RNA binding protein YcfA (HicA-like mRNA interferase family)
MSSAFPPLQCRDVKRILKNLGFSFVVQRGSHEKWQKTVNGKLFSVTVDCPHAPFSQTLITSMASQAGVSKKQFYEALS